MNLEYEPSWEPLRIFAKQLVYRWPVTGLDVDSGDVVPSIDRTPGANPAPSTLNPEPVNKPHIGFSPTPLNLNPKPSPQTLNPKCIPESKTRTSKHPVNRPHSRSQPYTLHPTPYTLYPTLYTLRPTPYTLLATPYTLKLGLNPTLNLKPLKPRLLNPKPLTTLNNPKLKP